MHVCLVVLVGFGVVLRACECSTVFINFLLIINQVSLVLIILSFLLIPRFLSLTQALIRGQIIFMREGMVEILELIFVRWSICIGSCLWSSCVARHASWITFMQTFPDVLQYKQSNDLRTFFQEEGNDTNSMSCSCAILRSNNGSLGSNE